MVLSTRATTSNIAGVIESRRSYITAPYKVFHQDKNVVCSLCEYVVNNGQTLRDELNEFLIMKQNSYK